MSHQNYLGLELPVIFTQRVSRVADRQITWAWHFRWGLFCNRSEVLWQRLFYFYILTLLTTFLVARRWSGDLYLQFLFSHVGFHL